MNGRLYGLLAALSAGVALLTNCGRSTPPESAAALNVTVSILPQKYFVERIGGGHVSVNVMVEPGASPATYEPKPQQLAALSRSAAYFSIGVAFEQVWLEKISSANPDMLLVDTAAGIERMPMGEETGTANLDPHIWLSPRLVEVQAQNICAALAQIDPTHAKDYDANLASFEADIDALDTDIRQKLAGVESRKFIVFHPAWGYFARDYGLEMIPIEVGGQEPSAAELAQVIAIAQEEHIQVVLAQPEFSTRSAETIAGEIGGRVLLISPLAPDWLDNMRRVADTFTQVLSD